MKKILIILPSLLENLGGIETYNNSLIPILEENNFLVDLYILEKPKNIVFNNLNNIHYSNGIKVFYDHLKNKKFIKAYKTILNIRSNFYSFLKNKNYSLIIDNTNVGFKNLFKKENALWIQHFDYKFLTNRNFKGIKKLLFIFLKWILKTNTPFKKYKNLVVFKNSKSIFKNSFNNVFEVSPCSKIHNFSEKKKLENKEIIFCGRINEYQKNISLLLEVDNELRQQGSKIIFYGDGETHMLSKADYRGRYSYNEIIKIYDSAKLTICLSNYEGCPLFLIESLAFNTPIAVLNAFETASFLTNNNSNGILLENNNPKIICDQILNFIKTFNYKKNNIKKFYFENLSYEKFKKDWEKILKELNI